MRYDYLLLDVFTDRAFGGNQLAVFPNATGLTSQQMQALANELNLAETTFVLPPRVTGSDFQVRIFTPVQEMPMAGHPTIGTAFALALEKMVNTDTTELTVVFEEQVGLIPVKIKLAGGKPTFCQMQQPRPEFGPQFTDQAQLAELLGLPEAELSSDLPGEVVSCGVPYLIIPVKSLAAIERLKIRPERLEKFQAETDKASLYLFTRQAVSRQAQVHSRMFWLADGQIIEDAATGSAAGPLGCYLAKHRVFGDADPLQITVEQGFELNRPSFLQVEIEEIAGKINTVRVGGQAVFMGRGYFELA